MKMSIRSFLLINLLLGELFTILLALAIILVWGYHDSQHNMDDRLLETAFSVQSFMSNPKNLQRLPEIQKNLSYLNSVITFPPTNYSEEYADNRILHYHITDAKGKTLLDSEDAMPGILLDTSLGFSNIQFDHQAWRAFTTIDPTSKIKIVLLQKKDGEHILPGHITRVVILAMLLSYPILGILIWLILNRGLKALQLISNQIQQQAPENFSYIDVENLPSEIKPIAEEWNKLFDRLKLAFDREKRFAGDAAHELKTPLAALKTHTQLALNAKSENELINALHKIVAGVNRSAHVVQQLLTLNRINQGIITEIPTPVDITQRAKEIIAELVPQAFDKNIEIELIAPDISPIIQGYDTAISILIRNLVDNAIRYCPEHSLVQVVIEQSLDKETVTLKVIDNGPGIPEHLRQRVFERFFRVIGNKSSGSGLGLGIVQQIVELHQATILLETPASGQGLQIAVVFPKILQK